MPALELPLWLRVSCSFSLWNAASLYIKRIVVFYLFSYLHKLTALKCLERIDLLSQTSVLSANAPSLIVIPQVSVYRSYCPEDWAYSRSQGGATSQFPGVGIIRKELLQEVLTAKPGEEEKWRCQLWLQTRCYCCKEPPWRVQRAPMTKKTLGRGEWGKENSTNALLRKD